MLTRRAALRGGAAAASVAAVTSAAAVGLASASTADPAIDAVEEFHIALAHSVQLERNVAENDPEIEFSNRYVGSDLVKSRGIFQGAFNRLTTVEVSSTAGVSALLGCIQLSRSNTDNTFKQKLSSMCVSPESLSKCNLGRFNASTMGVNASWRLLFFRLPS